MRRQKILATVATTDYAFDRNTLPLRQDLNVPVVRSPYSPPVKFLAEGTPSASSRPTCSSRRPICSVEISPYSVSRSKRRRSRPPVNTSRWILPISWAPYAHMNRWKPTSLNDDRIHTWTLSSAHVYGKAQTFESTMREKPGRLITGALFTVAEVEGVCATRCKVLGMIMRLVDVTRDFVFPLI